MIRVIALALALIGLAGCMSLKDRVMDNNPSQSQLQKRSYQSRVFDLGDKEKTLRAVISTMQDLGFVIDRADATLGTVSGTKLNTYSLKMTVSVTPRGKNQMVVRANATYNSSPLENPKDYQDFFAALSKSLFLQAQEID
jgi:hypothetical protein